MKKYYDVLALTRKLGREPNVDTALHILQWELGDVAKATTYMSWHPELTSSYKAEAKLALSSLVFQTMVVSKLLGFEIEELLEMGVDIIKGRIEEKQKKLGRFQHYVDEGKSG